MEKLIALLLFLVLYGIGMLVIWVSPDRLQAWATPLALLWLVVVSKLVAIVMAIRRSRQAD
jgi:hypothetical protein